MSLNQTDSEKLIKRFEQTSNWQFINVPLFDKARPKKWFESIETVVPHTAVRQMLPLTLKKFPKALCRPHDFIRKCLFSTVEFYATN